MRVLTTKAPARRVQETSLGHRSADRAQSTQRRGGWRRLSPYTAPAAYLGLFLAGGPVLEELDPGTAVPDAGLLRLLPLALLAVTVAQRAAAGLYKPLIESLERLPPERRALAYGCLYLAYFGAVLWTVVAFLVAGVH